MRHILFIDPLKKLTIKKDSTLMLALTLKQKGEEVYLLFADDFFVSTKGNQQLNVYEFEGSFISGGHYLDSFTLLNPRCIMLLAGDKIHMRLDPPFDSGYLRYLWMLKTLTKVGVLVVNSPEGIMLHNEKLYAYEQKQSVPSFVGTNPQQFKSFALEMIAQGFDALILKPLDLYQGIGIVKVELDKSSTNKLDLLNAFSSKVKEYQGPVVAQPFIKSVVDGEVRALYYKQVELGSIIKVPAKGEYLANIVMGATYRPTVLSKAQKQLCRNICLDLSKFGVDWIAFDLIGDNVSEVNITCPGLLVEVSQAFNKNLALEIS